MRFSIILHKFWVLRKMFSKDLTLIRLLISTLPKVPLSQLLHWFGHVGPVVQSILSLTTSLRRHLVKYMPTTLSNTLLFFVGKM